MILGVSSQAIALAGIIGAVVGLVGTLGVIFNTWIARRYEREARVWDAKSEANVRLLWYANRTMLDARADIPA